MIPKYFKWINPILLCAVAFAVLSAIGFLVLRPWKIMPLKVVSVEPKLPRHAFNMSDDDYDMIGEPFMSLNFSPMKIQLPDLQRYLTFYGLNGRPDSDKDHPLLHLAFDSSNSSVSIPSGEKTYLIYDRTRNPPAYLFSPDNKKTPLWITANANNKELIVNVGMTDENGNLVTEPPSRASFKIREKEFAKTPGKNWEINKMRVDGTLLARQKARWYGTDLFLSRHGGEEYQGMSNKNRIDFGDGDDKYSVFVGVGDSLIWNGQQWVAVKPGKDTIKYPIMVVNKVEDRIMNLELWDTDGKGKITLNLLKSNEAWMPQNLLKDFTFVGARTRSVFIFEVHTERMLVKPQDWLVQTNDGWIKLSTPEQIDDYVNGKIKGPLFVFDGVEKKNDQQILEGTLFNSSRTAMQRVELPIQQGTATFRSLNEEEGKGKKMTEIKPESPINKNSEQQYERRQAPAHNKRVLNENKEKPVTPYR